MGTNPKTVMISSTARDLPEHREEVMDACLQQDMFPKMMEYLPASDAEAIAASLDMVDEADIYVGIFAHRYGFIPQENNPQQISITEMEYNRAVERRIPRLIFLIGDDHPVMAKDVEKGDTATKLEAFKARIQLQRVAKFFSSPADLRAHVINSLSQLRRPDLVEKHKQNLIQDARRMERNDAYAEAIKTWEQIRTVDPSGPEADKEIQRLEARQEYTKGLNEKIKQLTGRIVEIRPIFKEVIEFHKQPQLDLGDPRLHITNSFLQNILSAADFSDGWQALSNRPTPHKTDEPSYRALADRLKRGEFVLFLGPDIPCLYDTPKHDTIIRTLAAKADYPSFIGSLATISEYYNIQLEYGHSSLISNLRGLIHSTNVQIPLYQKLAQIDQPLILISAAYDTFLEDAFQDYGKKYALISSIINPFMDHEVGNISVQYSDGKPSETFSPKEQLSGLDLVTEGYSLIYEIRGFLDSMDKPENSGCHKGALALSESNYFAFARYVDKVIPEYLIRQFAGRGLLFLGFTPRQWDDRLIIDAILDKRRQHRQHEAPCTIGQQDDDRFLKAYWEDRGVRRYGMDLQHFLTRLEACLP